MNRDYLRQLVDYHYWARDRLLTAAAVLSAEQYARPLGSSFASVRETLSHIFFAEWIWLSRWRGTSPTGWPGEPIPDVPRLHAKWQAQEVELREYLDDVEDLGIVIAYRLVNGTPGASPFWQMLVHVVNHASYHRGQVATMLRQLGARPAQSTDMVTFFRERAPVA